MENGEEEQEGTSVFDVVMSASVIYSLKETCRWARLLVYISAGAVLVSLALVVFEWDDVARNIYSANDAISYILWGVIMFICLMYIVFLVLLFIFSIKVKTGLEEKNVKKIEQGISSLKLYFILSAILSAYFIISFSYSIYKTLTA